MSAATDIAIVGMACRFPGANSPSEFWSLLRDGREARTELTDEQLKVAGVPEAVLGDPRYVKAGMFLQSLEDFDPGFFGFSPLDGRIMDPQHRHFLECVWEALEDAACDPFRTAAAIGVFAGSGHHTYLPNHLLRNPQLVAEVGLFLLRHTGNDKDFLATRASYCFDLRGPSVNVQTACSTSLVAVHLAAQSLLNGECDIAIAGGVTIELPHRRGYLYTEGEILSRDGHCRPFDESAGGTVFGSGVGVVVLTRLEGALEDGSPVHAVIKSAAINNDGAGKVSYLAPSVDGQAASIEEALVIGGIDPRSVSYIETHGTGTPMGDPIEVAALAQAYGRPDSALRSCGIGSVKSNIGHLDTAAGVASLIKVVMALRHRQLPATLHFRAPNPAIDFTGSPFYVHAKLSDWDGPYPLRAGVSSLGVGGTNAHVIVEEAPELPVSGPGRTAQLLLTSARSESSLRRFHDRLARWLVEPEVGPPPSLADVAYTLAIGRRAFKRRAMLVAVDADQAASALDTGNSVQVVHGEASPSPRDAAFMFAGGGAQYPGMGAGLYHAEPAYREAVEDCLAALGSMVAFDLRPLLFPGVDADLAAAARELERPSRTLPALFLTQYAQARLWQSWGVEPRALIGHSMGENTAACIAGVLSLHDALGLVVLRGRLFETVGRGGMLSVDLDESVLRPLLGDDVSIAAVNAPGLTVASGPLAALAVLESVLDARQVSYKRVHIDVAAHSGMLDGILKPFGDYLRSVPLNPPAIPFISNLTGTWISDANATDPDYWVRQLRQTVRFVEGVGTLLGEGRFALLEVGPGRTLATLAGLHPARGTAPVMASMRHPGEPVSDLEHMLGAMGRLWVGGVEPDWARFYHGQRRRRVSMPTYAFDHQRCWVDAEAQTTSTIPADGRQGDVGQWLYQPVWLRSAATVDATCSGARVLVVAGPHDVAKSAVEALRGAGADVRVVREGDRLTTASDEATIRIRHADDYLAAADRLQQSGWAPTHVLHLAGLEISPSLSAALSETDRARVFDSVYHLAQAAGVNGWTLRWVVAGLHALQVGGERPLSPLGAIALGPVHVLPREFSGWSTAYVDIEVASLGDPERLSRVLVRELTQAPGDDGAAVVAVRGGARYLRQHVSRVEPAAAASELRPVARDGGLYLITGGTGGLGLAAAAMLAEQARVTLVLLARRPLPDRAYWRTFIDRSAPEAETLAALTDLEARGATVMIEAVDVTDVDGMRALKHRLTRFGPLRGIIHAAGVVDDGLVLGKDVHRCHAVLAPKVTGTLVLDEVFGASPLDFMVLYSSTSALLGLPGQIDYAGANAFLDAFAHWRAADGGPHLSINWPAWRGAGMAARLATGVADRRFDAGRPADHPLLDRVVEERAERTVYATSFSVERHWILAEHRIKDGPALIPGAGFLELARAAWADARGTSGAVQLTDTVFEYPFLVTDDEHKVLRVVLEGSGPEVGFVLTSEASGTATEHVRGRIGPAQPIDTTLDLAAVRARCRGPRQAFSDPDHHPFLSFGPRWASLKSVAYGEGEALLDLDVAEAHRADLDAYRLHPALVDMATAGAQRVIEGYVSSDDFYVPVAYGQLTFNGRFPARAFSHVVRAATPPGATGRERVAFHVTVCDENGHVFLSARNFTLQHVPGVHVFQRAGQARPGVSNEGLARTLEFGLEPEEGREVLHRIIGARLGPQTLVSPYPLRRMLQELRQPARAEGPPAAPFDPDDDPRIPRVEAQLGACPAVASVVVRAFRGEGEERRLVAYFVPDADAFVTLSEVRRYARAHLPPDEVPQQFVEVDEWPLDDDGRPRRVELRDPLAPEDRYVAPRTSIEKAVASIWQDTLGVERVGLRDNFFDLGGHSLLSVRVIVQLSQRLGVRLDQATMVLGTLEQISRDVEERIRQEAPPAPAAENTPVGVAGGGPGLLRSLFGRKAAEPS